MRTLSDLGSCVMNDHLFDITIAMDFHFCPRVFLIPKREADILKSGRKANPARKMSFAASLGRRLVDGHPAKFLCRGLNHLRHADRSRSGRTDIESQPISQGILHAEFNRVDAEFFGKFIHLAFCHEQCLWCAESAEGRAWDIVGVNAINIRFNIGDEIRACTCNR